MKTKKVILLVSTIIALFFTFSLIVALFSGILEIGKPGDGTILSNSTQLLFLSICAICNILSIIFICIDITAHSKKIILLNIITILFGSIINIISAVVNIIVVPKNKEKKELPILEDITQYKWYVYFIIFILLFVICYSPIISLLPIPQNLLTIIMVNVVIYITQVTALVIPMFDELKRDFAVFKSNFKLYLGNMLPRFAIIFIVYLFVSAIISTYAKDIPNNQAILKDLPIYITGLLAIFVGPLTEELMFRGFIKKFIKNDTFFLILSSLIFGGLHVLRADSLQQFAYIIPYSVLGFAFSLNYVKTKNIASNIFLHSAWNTIAFIFMIFTNI